MKYQPWAALLAITVLAATSGCVTRDHGASGASVRVLMASQMVAPQAHPAAGTDAAAAVAAYNNYQQSYVTPTPQSDTAAFGSKH